MIKFFNLTLIFFLLLFLSCQKKLTEEEKYTSPKQTGTLGGPKINFDGLKGQHNILNSAYADLLKDSTLKSENLDLSKLDTIPTNSKNLNLTQLEDFWDEVAPTGEPHDKNKFHGNTFIDVKDSLINPYDYELSIMQRLITNQKLNVNQFKTFFIGKSYETVLSLTGKPNKTFSDSHFWFYKDICMDSNKKNIDIVLEFRNGKVTNIWYYKNVSGK